MAGQYAALLKVTPFVLSGTSLVIMLVQWPGGDLISDYIANALIYAALTAFALYFGVRLSDGVLSPAHAIGMVAFLSLPVEASGVGLWAVTIGALVGAATRWPEASQQTGGRWHDRLAHTLMVVARVAVSFAVAGAVYVNMGGSLPLDTVLWSNDSAELLALLAYALTYFSLYTIIYILELYVNRRPVGSIVRHNRAIILAILVLPVPFAIVSAELASGLSQPSEIMSLAALGVMILGLYAVSQSEQRTNRQLNEMMTLSVVTRAMRAHLELDGLLKTIYVQISTLFDVGDFTLLLYSNGKLTHTLVIRDGKELESAQLGDMADNLLLTKVIEGRQPLFVPEKLGQHAQANGWALPPDFPFNAWLGVPLAVGTGGYGVMSVALRSPKPAPRRAFGAGDMRLLTIVADSACIAIENAVLFGRQAERVMRLSTLNKVSAMLSGTLSPETVLDTVVSSASVVGESQAVALYLYMDDDEDESMPPTLVRVVGLSDVFSDVAPQPILADGKPLNEKYVLAVEDARTDTRAEHIRDLMAHDYLQALVEIPLAVGDEPLGVLVLFYDEAQTFSSEGVEILRAFGTQAGQAISNARKYATTDEAFQRSVEQLLSLAGIGRRLTSTVDLNEIGDLVLQHVMDATRASGGVVLLAGDDAAGEAARRVLVESTTEPDALMDVNAAETGVTRRAMQTGKIQLVDDVFRESWFDENPRLLASSRSQLAVPILRGRDTLGVITLESGRISGFTSEDSNFVAQVANQAVNAIDNARLFTRITEARDRLQVILDTMEEAILLIDQQGKIALANPRISLLDLSPFDLIDRKIDDALDDDDLALTTRMGFESKDDCMKMVQRIGVENGWAEHPPHLYVLPTQSGGRRYLQRYIIPVLDEAAQTMGALLVFYDQTHEQELTRTREELTRMIVHDLRAPLTAVTTGLRLLERYVQPGNEAYDLVQSTSQSSRQAVQKLLNRVDSLLDIAKMQSGRLAVERGAVDLRAVVATVQDELRPLAKELDIRIEQEIMEGVPLLHVDRDKVERLLLNLLDNALKYSPTHQAVTVQAYAPGTHGATAGYVRVQVCDHGPGVPDDYREALFDSFVQVEGRRNVRRGVGLGLSFCKLVAEAHGGTIWIEDNQPNGSVFAFTLPIMPPPQAPQDANADAENGHKPPSKPSTP